MKSKLTLDKLQKSCKKRTPLIFPACKHWDEADWVMALVGELGEMCNILKKVKRGTKKLSDKAVHKEVAHEYVDALTYFICLANFLDIKVDKSMIEKFNIVSDRCNCKVKL